jgi:hypothetical protein
MQVQVSERVAAEREAPHLRREDKVALLRREGNAVRLQQEDAASETPRHFCCSHGRV